MSAALGRRPPEPGAAVVLGVLPGEGVGPEVVRAALDVLHGALEGTPHRVDVRFGGAIGLEALALHGSTLTPEVESFCAEVFAAGGAVLCGPGGGRFVYELRERFALFCKLTPVASWPELADVGPLRRAATRDVDLLFVRENLGGFYQGPASEERAGGKIAAATQAGRYDAPGVTRILEVALRCAERRRRRLAVVHKPGGIPTISRLWEERARAVCAGRDIELELIEIDNACFQVVADGARFDVVVAPNLFGDVIADVAGVHLASRGMSFSANFSADGAAVYQTGHGAARDIAGTDTANPLGQIQSLAMLVTHALGLAEVGERMLAAARRAVALGLRTADLARPGERTLGTRAFGERVAELALGAPSVAGRAG